jgi:hypothetical protein
VFDLITEAEDTGWQFVFLGINQDSWLSHRVLDSQGFEEQQQILQ